MDWLAFISSIGKTLVSWPVAAVITLVVLKRQVAAVLLVLGNRLSTMKLFGLELSFTEVMGKLEGQLPSLVATKLSITPAEPKQIENFVDTRSELSKLPPAYVVSQAWIRLRQAIYDAVETVHPGAGIDSNRDILEYFHLARLHVLLLPDEEPVVQELLVLRNQAVLSPDSITSTDALRYYDFVEALIANVKERVEQVRVHASSRRANPCAN
jgi:hypothetical protein